MKKGPRLIRRAGEVSPGPAVVKKPLPKRMSFNAWAVRGRLDNVAKHVMNLVSTGTILDGERLGHILSSADLEAAVNYD